MASTQILMNSRIPGSGKSHFDASGTLGRYVMDHIFRVGISGDIPGMTDYIEYGRRPGGVYVPRFRNRSEEHTSELQSLMRISYAVFCLKKKIKRHQHTHTSQMK